MKKIFLILLPFALLLNSCKKQNDFQVEDTMKIEAFLNLPANASIELKNVITDLRKQLNVENFTSKFISINGQPLWDNIIIAKKNGEDFILYIPTKKQTEKSIAAFFVAAYKNGKFNYELHSRDAIDNNAKEPSSYGLNIWKNEFILAKFEKQVFNKVNIVIKNLSPKIILAITEKKKFDKGYAVGIYNSKKRYLNANSSALTNTPTTNTVNYDDCCIEIWWNPNSDACNCDGDEYYTGVDDCSSCPEDTFDDEDGPTPIPHTASCPWWFPTCSINAGGGSVYGINNGFSTTEIYQYLSQQLGLNTIKNQWLQNNWHRAKEIFDYLYGSYTPEKVTIVLSHLYQMMSDPTYLAFVQSHETMGNTSLIWWKDVNWITNRQFIPAEYSGFLPIEQPINLLDAPVEGNSVSISNAAPPNPLGLPIGGILPRGNTEDMQHGTNGDPTGILNLMPGFTDPALFNEMNSLFYWCTFFDNDLKTVGDKMIQKFKNRTGGNFSDPILTQKVFESNAFQTFLQKFGQVFNARVQAANGNINAIPFIDISKDDRPVFNGAYNKFHGLQILVNDTEETKIDLEDLSYNPTTHKWTAYFTITIYDHFGLDKNDALVYQNNHAGFAAWWLLQNTRDYVPFTTVIRVPVMLTWN